MEAYRDQYARIFNSGKKVVVIGISADPDTTLASWARELGTPVLFASDVGVKVGTKYGASGPGRSYESRHVYVIGPDGRITYRVINFNVLSQQAYEDLGRAVARTLPAATSDGQ